MEISEVIGIDERGNIKLNPLFQFKEDKKLSTMDHVVGSLQRTENAMVKTELHHSIGNECGTAVNFIQEQSNWKRISVIVLLVPIWRNELGFACFGINAWQTNQVANIRNLGGLEFYTILMPNILCEPTNDFGLADTMRALEHNGVRRWGCCENCFKSANIHNLFFPFCLWLVDFS